MTPTVGLADLHSHLVPGVDDGARTLEEALNGVGRMVDAGVDRIVTTPHFDASLLRDAHRRDARLEQIDEAFGVFEAAVAEAHPALVLERGHEVMLDDPFPDLSDDRLRLAGSQCVLVEWPGLRIPPGTPEVIARIRAQGWIPIIAHPERYQGILREFALVSAWRRAGAYLQMNHGSLLARYGPGVQAAAFRLLEGGWVDVLSSDFHSRSHLPVFVDEARAWFEERGQEEVFDLLVRVNPDLLLSDEPPDAVPSFTIERGFWDRLTGFLRPKDS
jgi:protein-tyrosine phosphatase